MVGGHGEFLGRLSGATAEPVHVPEGKMRLGQSALVVLLTESLDRSRQLSLRETHGL